MGMTQCNHTVHRRTCLSIKQLQLAVYSRTGERGVATYEACDGQPKYHVGLDWTSLMHVVRCPRNSGGQWRRPFGKPSRSRFCLLSIQDHGLG